MVRLLEDRKPMTMGLPANSRMSILAEKVE